VLFYITFQAREVVVYGITARKKSRGREMMRGSTADYEAQGERRKLSQQGPERGPDRNRVLVHSKLEKSHSGP